MIRSAHPSTFEPDPGTANPKAQCGRDWRFAVENGEDCENPSWTAPHERDSNTTDSTPAASCWYCLQDSNFWVEWCPKIRWQHRPMPLDRRLEQGVRKLRKLPKPPMDCTP